ncbi:phospholipase D [Scheffersomyces coipomensis]|uniref:phospholipase D n=1 Tax=Scheffersomyces coipomensis TaxID=1788519 RepID=UPI00315D11EE
MASVENNGKSNGGQHGDLVEADDTQKDDTNIEKENGHEPPKALREDEDFNKIYHTISAGSNDESVDPKSKTLPIPFKRKKSVFGPESPKIISNPLTYFNKFSDRDEQRYVDEEQESRDRMPFHRSQSMSSGLQIPDIHIDGNQIPVHPHSQSFANFMPTMFSRSGQHDTTLQDDDFHHTEDLGKQQTLKKMIARINFKMGGGRKKQSITAFNIVKEPSDQDKQTGERAQKLVGNLAVGITAINLLASCLLEDEHGIARAPLVLNLIGLNIVDISPNTNTRIRRFRIELEYGVGESRQKWFVDKNARDLLYLHSRFKFERWKNEVVRNKNTNLPKCPIPPLRTKENAKSRAKSIAKAAEETKTVNEQANAEDEEEHSFRNQLSRLRSHLSSISSLEESSPEQLRQKAQKNQEYIREVHKYLTRLIALVDLNPQSNRLFHFFELSPISSLLSYETGFQGKQGIVHVTGTARSQGWRVGHFRANDLKGMIDRRAEKWFLIRNTYVMYVSDINSTIPLEVFLVDSDFKVIYNRDYELQFPKEDDESDLDDSSVTQKKIADTEGQQASHNLFNHFQITLENSERKLSITPKSFKEHKLWVESLVAMKNSTIWSQPHNRFDSFAPVRENCFAQWFIDARDYFWSISAALELAKDTIFIHDWWLTPEMYLRRPANGNQQWRLDRILQRKAQQGVKIFVIVYRNVGSTVATDSLYTKHSILSLNEENIHVIRSPNQLLQNTYFWAHHEKICVIDSTVAYVGGIDMCYGRYDTPDHVLVDDSNLNFDSFVAEDRVTTDEFIKFQTFTGKDYSNPRVKDFSSLERPYETMYDRNTTPRMPWHDVHMVTAGQVAVDLGRHFVQRWNYLLRQKRPSRFTPLLTPPSDMSDEYAKELGLNGTCEIQIVRSAGSWSLGLKDHEQSVQNAYLKLIETSEHFVYIENQFFVTSTIVDGTEIQNRIGDALVDRIIRAHSEKKAWRAVIIIPLMPGFESQVDEPDGSSVRVIMQCQYRSISRGRYSIFGKLQALNINPDDYIQFFSLRKWGQIGPDRNLVTEQLYIHAKIMIVDDKYAIIGSANINERSMRGVRDSEVAAVVKDTEMITTTMNGEPYKAGKFAHTMRMRLMREHLGINVDILEIVERRFKRFEEIANTREGIKASTSNFRNIENLVLSAMVELSSRDILNEQHGTQRWKNFQKHRDMDAIAEEIPMGEDIEADDKSAPEPMNLPISFNNRTGSHEANSGIRDKKKHSYDVRVQHSDIHKKDVYGEGLDKYRSKLAKKARQSCARFLKELAHISMEENPTESFLPDLDSVKEFLESDDHDMFDEMDEASEEIINERNKERWMLLKRISYLQRISAKSKREQEEESKKRVQAGLSPTIIKTSKKENSPKRQSPETVTAEDIMETNLTPQASPPLDVPDTSKSAEPPLSDVSGGDVPIVSLSESEVQDLLDTINTDRKVEKFIDPYGFEDPIKSEFYADLWFENARRNTELFRKVFHTQPDDLVSTWKSYKEFSKLQKAFIVSQKREAERRRKNHEHNSLYGGSETDEESNEPDEVNGKNNRQSINISKLDSEVGLLGQAPPSANNGNIHERKQSKLLRHLSYARHPIPEHNEGIDPESPEFQNGNSLPPQDESFLRSELNGRKNGGYDDTQEYFPIMPVNNDIKRNKKEVSPPAVQGQAKRKQKGTTNRKRPIVDELIYDRSTAERILSEIQGNLVFFPADWLCTELDVDNWFYSTDRIPPIEIFD